MTSTTPVFIGGTNGSGTRLYAKLLELNGIYQGSEKNYAYEPTHILKYTKHYIPWLMRTAKEPVYSINNLPEQLQSEMKQWITECAELIQHQKPSTYQHWGWKHPRNIFLLPFFLDLFPNFFFIHIIRDGRDMAFANNTVDATTCYQYLQSNKKKFKLNLRSVFKNNQLTPSQLIKFWEIVNCSIAEWYTTNMPSSNYIVSKYEDLCDNPESEIKKILNLIHVNIKEPNLHHLNNSILLSKINGTLEKLI